MAIEDLKPHQFKKGQSGNPSGKPKGTISVISRLKKEFRENPEVFEEFMKRYKNNPQNEKHIAEMIDGKPKQNVSVEGDLTLNISFDKVFDEDKTE